MNYQWARDAVLKLVDRYSVAGNRVTVSYNDQSDILAKIPGLLDDAQSMIASTTRKIRKTVQLGELAKERRGSMLLYTLPQDCIGICGGLIRLDGEIPERKGDYRVLADQYLALSAEQDGDLLMEYYRRPVLLGDDPAEDAPLDNTVEAQMALPYYAAAQLMLHEDTGAYQLLANEWERRLARLSVLPRAESGIVEDDYHQN